MLDSVHVDRHYLVELDTHLSLDKDWIVDSLAADSCHLVGRSLRTADSLDNHRLVADNLHLAVDNLLLVADSLVAGNRAVVGHNRHNLVVDLQENQKGAIIFAKL